MQQHGGSLSLLAILEACSRLPCSCAGILAAASGLPLPCSGPAQQLPLGCPAARPAAAATLPSARTLSLMSAMRSVAPTTAANASRRPNSGAAAAALMASNTLAVTWGRGGGGAAQHVCSPPACRAPQALQMLSTGAAGSDERASVQPSRQPGCQAHRTPHLEVLLVPARDLRQRLHQRRGLAAAARLLRLGDHRLHRLEARLRGGAACEQRFQGRAGC